MQVILWLPFRAVKPSGIYEGSVGAPSLICRCLCTVWLTWALWWSSLIPSAWCCLTAALDSSRNTTLLHIKVCLTLRSNSWYNYAITFINPRIHICIYAYVPVRMHVFSFYIVLYICVCIMKALSVLGGSPRLTRHCCENILFVWVQSVPPFTVEWRTLTNRQKENRFSISGGVFFFFSIHAALFPPPTPPPPLDNTLCSAQQDVCNVLLWSWSCVQGQQHCWPTSLPSRSTSSKQWVAG